MTERQGEHLLLYLKTTEGAMAKYCETERRKLLARRAQADAGAIWRRSACVTVGGLAKRHYPGLAARRPELDAPSCSVELTSDLAHLCHRAGDEDRA